MRNWRQWSAVSTEELAIIAERLGISKVDPSLLGANISFSVIENLTKLPRGSTIRFANGTILAVESENEPCIQPGKEIAKVFETCAATKFAKAAKLLRGLVGEVHCAGVVSIGDTAQFKLP